MVTVCASSAAATCGHVPSAGIEISDHTFADMFDRLCISDLNILFAGRHVWTNQYQTYHYLKL